MSSRTLRFVVILLTMLVSFAMKGYANDEEAVVNYDVLVDIEALQVEKSTLLLAVKTACPVRWEDIAVEVTPEVGEVDVWDGDSADKEEFKLMIEVLNQDSTIEEREAIATDPVFVMNECIAKRVRLLNALITLMPDEVVSAVAAVDTKKEILLNDGFLVGDIRHTGRVTPAEGWIFLRGQEVGSPDSGAELSGNVYRELYELARNWIPNGITMDWDAGQKIILPDMRGKTIIAPINMEGTTPAAPVLTSVQSEVLGGTLGSEKHVLTSSQMPAHKHTSNNAGGHTHGMYNGGNHRHTQNGHSGRSKPRAYHATQAGEWSVQSYSNSVKTGYAGTHNHALVAAPHHKHTINNTGGGAGHSSMQPSIVFNVEMKYRN